MGEEEIFAYRVWDKKKKEYLSDSLWKSYPQEGYDMHFEMFYGHTDYEIHEFKLLLHKKYDQQGNLIVPFEKIK